MKWLKPSRSDWYIDHFGKIWFAKLERWQHLLFVIHGFVKDAIKSPTVWLVCLLFGLVFSDPSYYYEIKVVLDPTLWCKWDICCQHAMYKIAANMRFMYHVHGRMHMFFSTYIYIVVGAPGHAAANLLICSSNQFDISLKTGEKLWYFPKMCSKCIMCMWSTYHRVMYQITLKIICTYKAHNYILIVQ